MHIRLEELARRESEQVEWKEQVADVMDVVATLCAFANDLQNLGGGYVVCGAREDTDAHGFPLLVRIGLSAVRLKEIEHRVLASCRDRISPPLASVGFGPQALGPQALSSPSLGSESGLSKPSRRRRG